MRVKCSQLLMLGSRSSGRISTTGCGVDLPRRSCSNPSNELKGGYPLCLLGGFVPPEGATPSQSFTSHISNQTPKIGIRLIEIIDITLLWTNSPGWATCALL